jgi:hypothetical protein
MAGVSRPEYGYKKGEPFRFIRGHANRLPRKKSRVIVVKRVKCRTFPLQRGMEAIVNLSDYKKFHHFCWFAHREGNNTYVWTRMTNGKYVKLHRMILSFPPWRTDHINGNGLDNRRCNLRKATAKQNSANMHKRKGCSSRFKGVRWFAARGKWQAYIWDNKRYLQRHLGYFIAEESAARAYDDAARIRYGEYASLNFPNKNEIGCLQSGVH